MKSIIFVHALVFSITKDNRILTPGGIDNDYLSRFRDAYFSNIYLVSRSQIQADENHKDFQELNGVDHYFIRKYLGGYKFLFNPKFYYDLYKKSRKDSLIVINYPSSTGVFVLVFARLLKLPFVVEVASDSNQYHGKKFGKFLDFLSDHIGRICIPHAIGALYVAEFLREKWNCENHLILSNVVVNEVREIRKFPVKDTLVIVTVGAISFRKGIDIIVSALEGINIHNKIELHIVGPFIDNEIVQIVEDFYREGVVIIAHGILPRPSVMQLLDQADVYVQASRSEGLPRAMIEAMSRGLPVIASDLPGLRGVIGNDYKFDIGDSVQLMDLLANIACNKEQYEKSSRSSVSLAKTYLSSTTRKIRNSFYHRCHEEI